MAAFAQTPLNDLVFTVGTTTTPLTNGSAWSYVLLGSPQLDLLAGKRFAIYSKPGFPTNAGTFTLRGTMFQQTDTAAINGLLNQALPLGEDLNSLSNVLNIVLRSVPGITNLGLPQKVAAGLQVAATDATTRQILGLVGRTHPGLMMCAGQAFSELISTVTTYEVREVNPASGAPGDVAGRVTIIPGTPVVLPAPGAPFQVVSNGPIDHLRVRLRWGTPDAFRRLSLLGFGYNVWRIPRAAAETLGYNITPPTLGQLYTTNFTRANDNVVTASKEFSAGSGAGAADDPADPVTAFFSDGNGRSLGNAQFPTNVPAGYLATPFADGAEFYYFITARDLLGRDSLVSPGGLAKACRRLPPQAPTDVRVANSITNTNQARLLITWLQNTNAADAISNYWIYRWPNPRMAFTNEATPFSNRVGIVAQIPGTNLNTFTDLSFGAPTNTGPSNFWYTVRAVSHAACADLYSPNSGPAWGVVRERAGPAAASGNVQGSCGTPVVMFQHFTSSTNTGSSDTQYWNLRLTCQRRDPGIAWVQFVVANTFPNGGPISPADTLAPTYFPPDGDIVQLDYPLQKSLYGPSNDVTCIVGTYNGLVSAPAICHFGNQAASNQVREAVFLGGQLLETALDVNDPLLTSLNGFGPYCFPASNPTPDPSGTVRMTFGLGQIPLLIQVLESNVWSSLGVYSPDSNGVYWVSYPACLIGPQRSFQGCLAYLPGGTADCAQHVARRAADGPVAPIRIRFGLTPRSHEYRLYRSVNDGPLTLLAQGAAAYAPGLQIVRTDDTMPPSAARLCYFVQLLDENGNGSPMSFLGCKDNTPSPPPQPVLAEPQAVGDTNNPQVALNWFCPTGGVYRFQIKVERADQPASGLPLHFSASKLVLMATYNPATRYVISALALKQTTTKADAAWLTPPVGTNFGPGPQFTLTANVQASVPYNISVASMDSTGTNAGVPSRTWKFTWVPPIVPVNVPWPARPFPAVKGFDDIVDPTNTPFSPRVHAVVLSNFTMLDRRYPVGIRIGDITKIPGPSYFTNNLAGTNLAAYTVFGAALAPDPNDLIFRRRSDDSNRRGDPLLPIVVYRQQVANTAFPVVSGHLTQVTPLLERIPWTFSGSPGNLSVVIIQDRLICGGYENDNRYDGTPTFLYLRDQQPIILGASYQYWVVRLSDKREVAEIIDAGTVSVPGTP